jgi:hypothetical protein
MVLLMGLISIQVCCIYPSHLSLLTISSVFRVSFEFAVVHYR